MRIVKKPSNMNKIRAAEEIKPTPEVEVEVTPQAGEFLFETEDVAELLAEVTEEEVIADINPDEDTIVFTVGDEEYIVEPEGNEEVLEASTKVRNRKAYKHRVNACSATRTAGYRRTVKRK